MSLSLPLLYFILLLAVGLLNFIFAMVILRELSERGRPAGFFDLRWHILKNLKKYQEITRKKYGRAGVAYYGYLGTLALLILSAALLLQSLVRG